MKTDILRTYNLNSLRCLLLVLLVSFIVLLIGCTGFTEETTEPVTKTGFTDTPEIVEETNEIKTEIWHYDWDETLPLIITAETEILDQRRDRDEVISFEDYIPGPAGQKVKATFIPRNNKVKHLTFIDYGYYDFLRHELSSEEGKYAVRICYEKELGEAHKELLDTITENNEIKDMVDSVGFSKLDLDESLFADEFEIKKLAKYIVFDTEDIVLRTTESKEVVGFFKTLVTEQ